jgi:hypothetical protein
MVSIPTMKTHRMMSWIKKQDLILCCIQEVHLMDKTKYWLRMKDFPSKWTLKVGRSRYIHIW